eukprot:7717891-Pyramimonas_sp.AAC.1
MHAGGSRDYGPGAPRGGSRYSCIPVLSAKGRHSPSPVRAPSSLHPERRFAASLDPCGELQRRRARDIPRELK